MSALELGANVFNLLSVWFSARNNVHTWWSGIVGCALYGLLFLEVKLYADVTLQLFFIASCVIGWWNWKRGGVPRSRSIESAASSLPSRADAPTELAITRVAPWTAALLALVAIGAAAAYGWMLQSLTDAANPFIDSTVLALSILAQLLMVARKIETWPVWFIVDCVAVPLYGSKGLWLTALVYAFFLVLVVMGWLRWTRLLGREPIEVAA